MFRRIAHFLACAFVAAAAPAFAAPAPSAASHGCAAGLEVVVDKASLTGSGAGPFSVARVEILRRSAERLFKKAADELCRSGKLKPAALRPFKRLLIQSGSGADNVAVYSDPSIGRQTLVFQWVFAEADLALPSAGDVRDGISCWSRPDAPACAEREP